MLSLVLDRRTVYKEMVNDKWLSQAVHKFNNNNNNNNKRFIPRQYPTVQRRLQEKNLNINT